MHAAIEALSGTRREILLRIKQIGGATIAEIARYLSISDEGARQHLIVLERQGWLSRRAATAGDGRSGRPASVYEISSLGDSFFPKRYDDLCIALMDKVAEMYGPDALKAALARVTEERVASWEPKLRGKSLEERLQMLRHYYIEDDPFISVERDGGVSLVERNCPFRNVVMERPYICSVTVNVLTRLLGVRVCRVRQLQQGDGRCEFRVMTDEPVDASRVGFEYEGAPDPRSPGGR